MADGESEGSTTESPVSLFACHGKVYAWDADDVFKLRLRHRIVGSLIGSLPRHPRQNNTFSLPLLLSKEEVTLLLDKGLAKIFDTPKNIPTPSTEEVEKFNELSQDSIVKQIERHAKMQEEKKREFAEVIEEGRRRKREKTALQAVEITDSSKSERNEGGETKERDDLNQPDVIFVKAKGKNEGKKKRKRKCKLVPDEGESVLSKKMKSESLINQIVIQHSENVEDGETQQGSDICLSKNNGEACGEGAVLQEIEVTGNLLSPNAEKEAENGAMETAELLSVSNDSAGNVENVKSYSELGTLVHIPTVMPQRLQSLEPATWTHPQTSSEKFRYCVFKDLWEKGYYLTPGVNFGADFLAYPGDPMRYHSFYMVIIVAWEKRIMPFEIIAAGRLGGSVKKTALFCSVNEVSGEIVYTSVKWSGIS